MNSSKYAQKNSLADSMVNLIDLKMIKAKAHSYASFAELITDIQWIIHNCSIMYPGNFGIIFYILSRITFER